MHAIINPIHRKYQWLLSDVINIWKLITFVKALNDNHKFREIHTDISV